MPLEFSSTSPCAHKLITSCLLSSIAQCCACADQTWRLRSRINNIQRYCPSCKDFWADHHDEFPRPGLVVILSEPGFECGEPKSPTSCGCTVDKEEPLQLIPQLENTVDEHENPQESSLMETPAEDIKQLATTLDLNDPLEAWKICSDINLHFQGQPEEIKTACIACKTSIPPGSWAWRPKFNLLASKCPVIGHDTVLTSDSRICSLCEMDMVLKTTTRKQKCFSDGCKRLLIVNEGAVKKRVPENEYTNCAICMDELPIAQAPRRLPTRKCNHEPVACLDCLKDMLHAQINGGRWERISCPAEDCGEELDGRDIQAFTEPETFRIYNNYITNKALSQDPRFRWCCGTNINGSACTGGIIHPEEAAPEWRCESCRQLNCFECSRPGHPGLTCAQSASRQKDTGATDREIQRITKKCPAKGCGRRIEKNEGCINMKCRCGMNFCWNCKVIYGYGESPCVCDMHSLHRGCRRHLDSCSQADEDNIIPKPTSSHPLYCEDWDNDPGYDPNGAPV